jgi:hypothetical protein
MTWLTWRQSRAQAIAAATALAALAVVLWITGPNLVHLYDTSGIATCNPDGSCHTLVDDFSNKLTQLDAVLYFACLGLLLLVPGLIGVFWGAPLVTREIEGRSLPLAWNQSVTRTQWIAVKLGLVGLLAMATAGLLSLMVTWWASPIDTSLNLDLNTRTDLTRLGPILFDTRDITPVGYAAFAFALGVAAGVLIRRTVPAMAATLGSFAAVQLAWPIWIRQHLIAPVHAVVPLIPADVFQIKDVDGTLSIYAMPNFSQQGAWVLSSQVVDKAGHPFRGSAPASCFSNNFQPCQAWIGSLHLRQVVSYEPASRFWEFQWYETALFAAAALVLAGLCAWLIHRRGA